MARCLLTGAQIFDGAALVDDMCILMDGDHLDLIAQQDAPSNLRIVSLSGGILMPGFVDLQVNGGGGMMLGDAPSVETLETMAQAHARLGTRGFLPTLITDTPEVTQKAIAAVVAAVEAKSDGILGLHLEGPHLDPLRKGAHDAALIRPMDQSDMRLLLETAETLANLMVTLAPENVTLTQITELAQAGVIVSLGHSDCDYDTAMRAFDAGAKCSTHLFNAMSGLSSRAPGLVGASLQAGGAAGLIADGIHVHPAAMRAALAAKDGPGEVFLVTDAMACAGTDMQSFALGGREILRRDGRLTLGDGTLAGADLSMAQAIGTLIKDVGDAPAKALERATSIPAGLLRDPMGTGQFPATLDGLIYLDGTSVHPASQLL